MMVGLSASFLCMIIKGSSDAPPYPSPCNNIVVNVRLTVALVMHDQHKVVRIQHSRETAQGGAHVYLKYNNINLEKYFNMSSQENICIIG